MARDFVQGLADIDERVAADAYDALDPIERVLYDVSRFHFECVCGGLGVFFTNSTGTHWSETIGALGRVGAPRAQRTLMEACALFPAGAPPADQRIFEAQANDPDLQNRLNKLGAQIDDSELWDTMESYWKAHASRFDG